METGTTDLLDRIECIYSAAVQNERWQDLIDAVHGDLDAHIACLRIESDDNPELFRVYEYGYEESLRDAYAEHWIDSDPWRDWGVHNTFEGSITLSEEVMWHRHWRRTPIYQAHAHQIDMDHGINVCLFKRNGFWVNYLNYRPHSTGAFGRDDRRYLEVLTPHLRHAVEIQRQIHGSGIAAAPELEALPMPAWLLSPSMTVIGRSQASLDALSTTCVQQRGSKLVSDDPQLMERLKRAVKRMGDAGAGHTVLGSPLYAGQSLVVTGVQRDVQFLGATMQSHGALVTLSHTSDVSALTDELLAERFDLTPTEASVARALCTGTSTQAIAESRGITSGTLRWHVKRVMAKVGAERQTALVAHLRAIAAGLVRHHPGGAEANVER